MEHDKIINKLEGEKFKLEMENEILKKSAKDMAKRVPQ
jgi:hypothetical protein